MKKMAVKFHFSLKSKHYLIPINGTSSRGSASKKLRKKRIGHVRYFLITYGITRITIF